MKSVELFSGCGGLALGLARAGFEHSLLVEQNATAVETINLNKRRGIEHVSNWKIVEDDVRSIDWSEYRGRIDLVAGGPPCQPFSIGGQHRGHKDDRDMWPEAIRAVREIAPLAFIFENVRGLLRPAFEPYLYWIQTSLERPHVERRHNETYGRHRVRMEREKALYDVIVLKVNAADFGTPQKRHRVIVAGVRRELRVRLSPPEPIHSSDALFWEQYITGAYWKRHRITPPVSLLTEQALEPESARIAWRTVRDALKGLGSPHGRRNHVFQEGARQYPGHTGSPLDQPAKALKAGDHGVPGGENMIVLDDGSVRYLTVREASRLQGLPDDFVFDCPWTEAMRQIGNAVPTQISEAMGVWLRDVIQAA